jgi:hypothetical protein
MGEDADMIEITGTTIKMTRGDTLWAQIEIEKDGEPYTPQEGDVVRFYLKHEPLNSRGTAYKDPEPLINKEVPIETMILAVEPEDTKPLDFGRYKYDIEITMEDGRVDTFINNAVLVLVPEVG